MLLNQAGSFEKSQRVGIVLRDAGSDSQNIRIKYDVFWRKIYAFGKKLIAALTNLKFPFGRIGLAPFVKCHHDDRRTIPARRSRLFVETYSSPSFRLMELITPLP